jgi:hypothetical protein
MSSVVIAGNTSGTVTLQAPDIAGTTTLTLPTTSGTVVVAGGAQTIEFADGSASSPSITNSGDTNTGLFFPAADTIGASTGGTERMRIDSSGNLLVGTTTNLGKLTAQGTITAKASADESILSISHNGSEAVISASYGSTGSYDPMVFKTSDAERMRIDSSGTLLVGTTTVSSGASVQASFVNANGGGIQFGSPTNGGGALVGNATGGMLFFGYSGSQGSESFSERMRIDSSGYVLVGCTAYPSSSVAGAALSPSVVSVNPHRFSVGSGTGVITVMTFVNGNGIVGAINTSGSNTVYSTSSDYRLKENIAPMTGALNKVALLKPCTYTWKADGSNGEGFIAHELAEVFPDAVVGEKDAVDADGEIKAQSIDTSFLVATLTAAIQEQQAIITDLKARIETLENK